MIKEACLKSISKGSYRGLEKVIYWWSKDIEKLRNKCHYTCRALKRMREKGKLELHIQKPLMLELAVKVFGLRPTGLPVQNRRKTISWKKAYPQITLLGRLELIVDTLITSQAANILPTLTASRYSR